MSRPAFAHFLKRFLRLAGKHSVKGSIHYVCMDWRHIVELATAGQAVFGKLKNPTWRTAGSAASGWTATTIRPSPRNDTAASARAICCGACSKRAAALYS
jgi:hypothetical protein